MKLVPTLLGLAAIVLWGTTIPVSRHATEQLGTFTSGALIYLVAGILGCGHLLAAGRLGPVLRQTPRNYLFGCGGLMVGYTVLLYLAVGLAADRQEVIAVTVANYLWPGLTLAFSVPLLHHKAHLGLLGAGIAASTVGVALAMGAEGGGPLVEFRGPVLAALVAAVAWGLYSNLSRRWAAHADQSGMPLFLLATGLGMLLVRLAVTEETTWGPAPLLEIAYMAIFPTLLAYTFWDTAMRKGNLVLVAVASYFTPLLSVWISSLYLDLSLRPLQWLASLLVVLGAATCRLSIRPDGQGRP